VHPETDGDILAFNQLCIALQQRTDECLLKAEQADRTADQISLQYEDLIDSLESSMIMDAPSETDLHNPQFAAETTNISRDSLRSRSHPSINAQTYTIPMHSRRDAPGSAGSEGTSAAGGAAKDKKERQSFWESTFGKDSKFQRPYEPMEEPQASSPPAMRSMSKNGKVNKGFLSSLRRKGNKEGKGDSSPVDFNSNGNNEKFPSNHNGSMI
jgi:hypothetical protein